MLQTRVIPCLLLNESSLVKTVNFKNPGYIGDPVNTARIFNELEVDELVLLDITATNKKARPNLKLLAELAQECFMPLAYGGGIRTFEDAKRIFQIGIEKIVINSYAFENPTFISQLAKHFGNQAVVASIDVGKTMFGKYQVFSNSGKSKQNVDVLAWAKQLEQLGAGEILLTAIHQEGTWKGFDTDLVERVSSVVEIPVIANGGASNLDDIKKVVDKGKASAVCIGSMVVYQNKGMGVLVNFPDQNKLKIALEK